MKERKKTKMKERKEAVHYDHYNYSISGTRPGVLNEAPMARELLI